MMKIHLIKPCQLPEQENYVPYHEDDFMFLLSDDKHDNMSLLSDVYSAEYTRIDSLCVCKQEKRQLHDILNIMTRSMSKSKKTDVPTIYPLKGEHKKPEHVKPQPVVEQIASEQRDYVEPADIPDVVDLPKQMKNWYLILPLQFTLPYQFILHLKTYMISQIFIHQE